jgi:hypothetical protein
LLGYSKKLGIDLLRTYLFCKMIYENEPYKPFTKRNLVRCLGHNETDTTAYADVEVYLDLLESWKLIYLNKVIKTDELGEHNLYNIAKVETESSTLKRRFIERLNEYNNPYGLTPEEEADISKQI